MSTIGIVDYGSGNILSVKRAIEKIGYKVALIKDNKEFNIATHIIIPGVGAFPSAMKKLQANELELGIERHISEGKSLLGICVGMQMLFEKSYEDVPTNGLGYLKGNVCKINTSEGFLKNAKVPNIGWSSVSITNTESPFYHLNEQKFYHVHSYSPQDCSKKEINGISYYAGASLNVLCSKDNIHGVQFHPEKSSFAGLSFLKAFIEKK